MRRSVALLTVVVAGSLIGGCGTGDSRSSPTPTLAVASVTPTTTVPIVTSSPAPTPRPEWPFVRASCESFAGEPLVVVSLGTSESAGWGIRDDEAYSPQAAYPALYADLLCQELGVPVELRSYFPSQRGNQLARLAWWIQKVEDDAPLRADLAAADVVLLWALSSHDVVAALLLGGACRGDWPDPLKGCLEEKTGRIPAETDELFGLIKGLVGSETVVLAGDAYAPPAVVEMLADEPYRDVVKAMVDPYFTVKPMARKHGFVFVDTELEFNGTSRWKMPADGLFQSDGLHPTAAGALLTAKTYAAADGLGE